MRQRKISHRRWILIWRNRNKKQWKGLLFLIPSLLGTGGFVFLPFLDVIRRSFFRASGTGFVGLANYEAVLGNEAFCMAVKNTARFLCICLPLLLGLSLLTAVLAGQVLRVSGLLKSGFLIPMAVPAASAVVFFRLMFDKNGWVNGALQAFGMEGQDWLNSGNAFAVLIACYVWKNLGYDMVLWMAGLSSIPKEQYEAARVQGAGELQCFLYITLPQLKETAFVTALLSFVNGFRVFREAYLIAGDYPHESIYMLQHLFNNWFTNLDIQKMTAATVMLVIVTGGVLLGNDICTEHFRRREEGTEESGKRREAGRKAKRKRAEITKG